MIKYKINHFVCIGISIISALFFLSTVFFNVFGLFNPWRLVGTLYDLFVAPIAIIISLCAALISRKAMKKGVISQKIATCDLYLFWANVAGLILAVMIFSRWFW